MKTEMKKAQECPDPDEVLRELRENLEPRIQAFRESERLSEEDFVIRITPELIG